MAKVEELENAILNQIELLSDDSIFNDGEAFDKLIKRSNAISDLSRSWIQVQQTKTDEKRVKIEAVKVMHECSVGIPTDDKSVKSYLGIGAD